MGICRESLAPVQAGGVTAINYGLPILQPGNPFLMHFLLRLNTTVMSHKILADFYSRDLRRLIDEVNSFGSDENLWRVAGSVKNSAGNLVLHITGGLNYFVGTILAGTGYQRNRDREFEQKAVEKEILVTGLEDVIPVVSNNLGSLKEDAWDANFPIMFDNKPNSTEYVLTQLLLHLNYHLGQVNYLRRFLE